MKQSAIITEQQWINIHRSMNTVRDNGVPLTMAEARPQIADGRTASNMEGNCEFIE